MGKKLPQTTDFGGLSPREQQLAALLAAGWKVGAACEEVGISVKQGWTYRQKPGFDELVNGLRAKMFDEAVGRLASITGKAIDRLEKILDDPTTKPAVLLSAARGVLADAIALRTSVEVEARISALEERFGDGPT